MRIAADELRERPDDLPADDVAELLALVGFEGPLSAWLDKTRADYAAIVYGSAIVLWGRPVVDAGPEGFWHAVTHAAGQGRELDLARCQLLPQVRRLLLALAGGSADVVWWREERRRRRKRSGKSGSSSSVRRSLMVAPADFAFVVQLREMCTAFAFVSAYPLSGPSAKPFRERLAASWGEGVTTADVYQVASADG